MVDYHAIHKGKKINFDTFSENDVFLEDIAHHLASPYNQRFGGAQSYETNYTVAQHSILLAEHFMKHEPSKPELARYALLHDASEAYLGDIPTYIKQQLPDYIKLESKVQSIILSKYNAFLAHPLLYERVEALDKQILANEVRALFSRELWSVYHIGESIKGIHVNPYKNPYEVKHEFLALCGLLGIKDE